MKTTFVSEPITPVTAGADTQTMAVGSRQEHGEAVVAFLDRRESAAEKK